MPAPKNYLYKSFDNEINNIVRDSAVEYQSKASKPKLTFEDFLSDKMLIIKAIKAGIPYSFFELIQSNSPFNESDWAHFLDISTKSLQRYKVSAKDFGPSQSEKIIEMAEVIYMGLEVFGNMDKFKLWLETPSFALANMKPIDLLSDSYGKELVITELTSINYGILV